MGRSTPKSDCLALRMPEISVLAIFGTSFLVGLSGAVSPGPLLAFNIKETVRTGFMAGLFVATGHSLLELVVVAALALGLTRLLDSDPAVTVIGVLGGLFLLWMSWGLVRNPGEGTPVVTDQQRQEACPSIRVPLVGGVLVSLSNPFWAIWWLTVGATFMTRSLWNWGRWVSVPSMWVTSCQTLRGMGWSQRW